MPRWRIAAPSPRATTRGIVTVLAYQLVQVIWTRLQAHGERSSWQTLRERLAGWQRVTAVFRRQDWRMLHVHKVTQAEPAWQAIYDRLVIAASPGGVSKLIV